MRTFIAVTLPPDVQSEVSRLVSPLRSRLPPASWTRPESQHLTLAFLGDQRESIVPALQRALECRVAPLASFEARLHGCGFFPGSRRPRVAWLGVEPETPLLELAAAVRDALFAASINFEAGTFRPHLTICRPRVNWSSPDVELFRSTCTSFESTACRVDSITLFSSRLGPGGAAHTPLGIFPMASSPTPA